MRRQSTRDTVTTSQQQDNLLNLVTHLGGFIINANLHIILDYSEGF